MKIKKKLKKRNKYKKIKEINIFYKKRKYVFLNKKSI